MLDAPGSRAPYCRDGSLGRGQISVATAMTSTTTVARISETNLRVLIADEDEAALRRLHEVLVGLGHEVAPYAVSVQDAVDLIAKEDPQVAIVVVHNDDEHALALIGEAVEFASGPVIAQLPDADVDFLSRAADRGISAYVESLDPESVQGAIEVAVRRYREAHRLIEKVDQLEGALERRAVIERAKGILMERHGVDERHAFELMRDHSRTSGRRVVEVAQAVLDGHALLPKHP
jgi:AmiR/NasT family two-component response regulator